MGLEEYLIDQGLDAQIFPGYVQSIRRLRFPAVIERNFEQARGLVHSRHQRIAILIALSVYDLFLICDWRLLPGHFLRCVLLRLGLTTPVTVGAYLWLRFDPPARLREPVILTIASIVSVTTIYLWQGVGGTVSAFAQTALILLILFVNAMIRLSFRYAVLSTALCIAQTMPFLYFDSYLTSAEKCTALCLVGTGAAFTLLANYWMEREERLRYLLHVQLEKRGVELAAANRELTRLSNVDALTGLANRRHFSLTFAEAWEASLMRRQPLSLLLIDIDHFKKINDEFGHLRGDEMLVDLGRIFRRVIRESDQIVARYGGEEFVALLPNLPLQKALLLAEQLRAVVEKSALAAAPGKACWGTISVGVASLQPTRWQKQEALLRAADLALYEAKSRGRNRVWVGSIPEPPAGEPLSNAYSSSGHPRSLTVLAFP